MPRDGNRRGKKGENAKKIRAKLDDPSSAATERGQKPVEAGALVRLIREHIDGPCSACGGSGKRTRGTCSACAGTGKQSNQHIGRTVDLALEHGLPIREQQALSVYIIERILDDLQTGEIGKASTGYRAIQQILETTRKLAELDVDQRVPAKINITFASRPDDTDFQAFRDLLDKAEDLEEARELLDDLEAEREAAKGYGDRLQVSQGAS